MLRRRFARLFTLLVCSATLAVATDAPETTREATFDRVGIADGVWLYRGPADDPRFRNSLVVERADGLLVVDAQPTPAAARTLLAEIGRELAVPVRYLVLSHPHAESAGGASAFPDEGLLVAASSRFNAAMRDPDLDFGADCALALGDAWTDPPRRLATLEAHARTTLADERNPVSLLPLQRGHSRGDLSVLLPEHRLVWVGGLIARGGRFYVADGEIEGTLRYLNNLIRDGLVAVGLHGDPWSESELRRLRDSLAWLRGRIAYHFVEGVRDASIADRILAEDALAEHFDRSGTPDLIPALVRRAVDEAISERERTGFQGN